VSIPRSAIEIAAVIFAVRFVSGEAAFEHASRRGDLLVFRPVLGLRLLIGLAIVVVLLTILEAAPEPHEVLWGSLLIAMMIGIYAVMPGTILVDRTSIRETRWFGLRRTRILWSEVSSAAPDIDNAVMVRAKDGRGIKHSRYHVDRAGFIQTLRMYFPDTIYNTLNYKPWVPLSGA
jgi:hypothetical protein